MPSIKQNLYFDTFNLNQTSSKTLICNNRRQFFWMKHSKYKDSIWLTEVHCKLHAVNFVCGGCVVLKTPVNAYWNTTIVRRCDVSKVFYFYGHYPMSDIRSAWFRLNSFFVRLERFMGRERRRRRGGGIWRRRKRRRKNEEEEFEFEFERKAKPPPGFSKSIKKIHTGEYLWKSLKQTYNKLYIFWKKKKIKNIFSHNLPKTNKNLSLSSQS